MIWSWNSYIQSWVQQRKNWFDNYVLLAGMGAPWAVFSFILFNVKHLNFGLDIWVSLWLQL